MRGVARPARPVFGPEVSVLLLPVLTFMLGSLPRRTSFFQPVSKVNSLLTAATSPVRRQTRVGVQQLSMKSSYSNSVRWKHFSMNIRSCRLRVLVHEMNEGRMEASDLAIRSVLVAENRRCKKAVRL